MGIYDLERAFGDGYVYYGLGLSQAFGIHNALEKLQVHHRRDAAAKLRAVGWLHLPGVRRAD